MVGGKTLTLGIIREDTNMNKLYVVVGVLAGLPFASALAKLTFTHSLVALYVRYWDWAIGLIGR